MMNKFLKFSLVLFAVSLSGCLIEYGSIVKVSGTLGRDLPPSSSTVSYSVFVDAEVNGKKRFEIMHVETGYGDRFETQVLFKDRPSFILPWDDGTLSVKKVKLSAKLYEDLVSIVRGGTPLDVVITKSDLKRNGGSVEIELRRPEKN